MGIKQNHSDNTANIRPKFSEKRVNSHLAKMTEKD
jgi:hypothetical protein